MFFPFTWCVGVVLGVVSYGGLLLTSNQLSAGELMAFLVATQTIQRYNKVTVRLCMRPRHWTLRTVWECNRNRIVSYTCWWTFVCAFFRSLGTLSVLFGQVVRAVSAGGRVMEFMHIQPSVPLHGGLKLTSGSSRGSVMFKDVTFSYPSRKDQVFRWYCMLLINLTLNNS